MKDHNVKERNVTFMVKKGRMIDLDSFSVVWCFFVKRLKQLQVFIVIRCIVH